METMTYTTLLRRGYHPTSGRDILGYTQDPGDLTLLFEWSCMGADIEVNLIVTFPFT